MKKIIIFIFSLMIVFTGCSAKQSAETSKNENSNSVNENTSSPKDNEPKLAYTITTEGAFFENDLYDVALYYPYITGGSKAEDITTEIKKINDERLNNIKEIYEKYTKRAKADHPELFCHGPYTPHVMRHTTATHLIESGVPLAIVKNILGHTSIQTTQIYLDISQQTVDRSMEKWNEKWFSKNNPDETALPQEEESIPAFLK